MNLNVIDLFAGCGGLSDGFLHTGFYKTLAAVDWELPTVNTLKNRMSEKWGYSSADDIVINFDIQRTEELLNGFSDDKFGNHKGINTLVGSQCVDIIIGGPPCQAYSMAGRVQDLHGMENDYRNYLFESYVKMVDHFKPKAFVFENVEGILSASPGGVLITDRIRKAFTDIGYDLVLDLRKNALFDTSLYGVPQKRKRIIIYGVPKSSTSQGQINEFYAKLKERRNKLETTSQVAFAGLPKFIPVDSEDSRARPSHQKCTITNGYSDYLNHEPRFHSQRDIEIFKILTEDIQSGRNEYIDVKSLIRLYEEKTGRKSKFHKYHVIKLDRPSNTIPAHLYKDGLRHIHPDPEQARSITVREAARLQTFDDDFHFLGSRGDQYKMIGNAVPPLFSKVIGEIVFELHQ